MYSCAYNAATQSKFRNSKAKKKKGWGEKGETTLILHLSLVETGLVKERAETAFEIVFIYHKGYSLLAFQFSNVF